MLLTSLFLRSGGCRLCPLADDAPVPVDCPNSVTALVAGGALIPCLTLDGGPNSGHSGGNSWVNFHGFALKVGQKGLISSIK
jgi:hypothetical protein